MSESLFKNLFAKKRENIEESDLYHRFVLSRVKAKELASFVAKEKLHKFFSDHEGDPPSIKKIARETKKTLNYILYYISVLQKILLEIETGVHVLQTESGKDAEISLLKDSLESRLKNMDEHRKLLTDEEYFLEYFEKVNNCYKDRIEMYTKRSILLGEQKRLMFSIGNELRSVDPDHWYELDMRYKEIARIFDQLDESYSREEILIKDPIWIEQYSAYFTLYRYRLENENIVIKE